MPEYNLSVTAFIGGIELDKEPTNDEVLQIFADMPEAELIGCMEVDSIEEVEE